MGDRISDRRWRVVRMGGDIGGRGMDVAAKPSGKTPPAPHHPPMNRTLVNDGFRFALPILRVLLRLESGHGHRPLPRLNPDFAPLRVIGWPWEGAPDDPAWREAMAAHPQADRKRTRLNSSH